MNASLFLVLKLRSLTVKYMRINEYKSLEILNRSAMVSASPTDIILDLGLAREFLNLFAKMVRKQLTLYKLDIRQLVSLYNYNLNQELKCLCSFLGFGIDNKHQIS